VSQPWISDPEPETDTIRVVDLREICDPLENPPWTDWPGGCLRAQIDTALEAGRVVPPFQSSDDHAGRIAWLALNGWQDAIAFDIPVDGMGTWWACTDGNHRLAAAIYRGDILIAAVMSGCCDTIETMTRKAEPFFRKPRIDPTFR
jgi:hypothetical protein